jgi:hypothetical protein
LCFFRSFLLLSVYFLGRGSSVLITTRYGLDDPGIEFRSVRDCPQPPRRTLEPTQPPLQWVPVLSLWVKVHGSGVYQSPPSITKVKERVELYVDSLFCFRGLFWGELHHFRLLPFISAFYCILSIETKQV